MGKLTGERVDKLWVFHGWNGLVTLWVSEKVGKLWCRVFRGWNGWLDE